jgi:Tfp pilus assembly PilM family ATPase
MTILGAALGPIGVELGSRRLSAVQVRRRRRGDRVTAVASVERQDRARPVEPEEITRLASILDRRGFAGRSVVLAVPRPYLLSATVDVPPASSGAPVDRIAHSELATAHRCDPESIESACWELPVTTRRDGACALVVGCRHEHAIPLLDAFADAGRTVTAIDAPSSALARAVARAAPANETVATLAIEWARSCLVLIRGSTVLFERDLATSGIDRLHTDLQAEADLETDVADYLLAEYGARPEPPSEPGHVDLVRMMRERIVAFSSALAGDVRLSLAYAEREFGFGQVARLFVAGEGGEIAGLAEMIGKEIDLPARALSPDDLADCSPTLRAACESPALTLAFGLAMRFGREAA